MFKRKFPRKDVSGKVYVKIEAEVKEYNLTDISLGGISVIEINDRDIRNLDGIDDITTMIEVAGIKVQFKTKLAWKNDFAGGLSIEEIDKKNMLRWIKLLYNQFQ